jgi:SsrA-binding protein
MKPIASNRKARHSYDISETYEVGIELKGMEVKSLRNRGCSIDESFARIQNEELYLFNMHVPEFAQASYFKEDTRRIRKLLLHRREINRLIGLTTLKGLTIIPLKIYFNERGLVKLQIGVAKGRKLHDKRKKIKSELANKEAEYAMRRYSKGRS